MPEPQSPREYRDVARKHAERVSAAAWEPQDADYETAATWAFYAYENAVSAAGLHANIKTNWKIHKSKAEAAAKLHEDGHLSVDVSGTLQQLNELRKDVQYGIPGQDLLDLDVEDLASDLWSLIDEVETFLSREVAGDGTEQ